MTLKSILLIALALTAYGNLHIPAPYASMMPLETNIFETSSPKGFVTLANGPIHTIIDEPDISKNNSIYPYLVAVVSPGVARLRPGAMIDLTFTVRNDGTKADTYDIKIMAPTDWTNLNAIPTIISLAGNQSAKITLAVKIPVNSKNGTVANFSIQAVGRSHQSADQSVSTITVVSALSP